MKISSVPQQQYIILRKMDDDNKLYGSMQPAVHLTLGKAIVESERLAQKFNSEFVIFEAVKSVKKEEKYVEVSFAEAVMKLNEGKEIWNKLEHSRWNKIIFNSNGHLIYEATGCQVPCSMNTITSKWRYLCD